MDIEFQSPDGDFVYSDVVPALLVVFMLFPFQSPDGDFVYSDFVLRDTKHIPFIGFNPLTGISSILTQELAEEEWCNALVSIP